MPSTHSSVQSSAIISQSFCVQIQVKNVGRFNFRATMETFYLLKKPFTPPTEAERRLCHAHSAQ